MSNYQKFINVYHFAPLSYERCDRKNPMDGGDEKKEPLYTGKIQVRLKTRTPVFIPDTHTLERKEGHKELSFFSYDGKTPVIPGSSLRGMLRSVYETVTNSCLSVVDLDEKPVKRTNDYYTPGLLRRDGGGMFSLVDADGNKAKVRYEKRPDLNCPDEFMEGTEVWVKVQRQRQELIVTEIRKAGNGEPQQGWCTGYYFKGEPGVKKGRDGRANAYVICRMRNRAQERVIRHSLTSGSAEVQELKSVLESYEVLSEKKITRNNHKGYKEYHEKLKTFLGTGEGTDYFPVHYSQIGREREAIIYLSPACITKEISYNTILDILEKQGEHHTCCDIRKSCPACRLFGMVGKNQKIDDEKDNYPNAWASSIRVQDAFLEKTLGNELFRKKITLMELSEPKKSSTEFYLKKPEGEHILSWTYDYYLYGRMNQTRGTVRKYIPQISGRKYYWHHQMPNLPERGVERTDRNCTVTPLNEGAVFTFPVYFEKITRKQMEQLIWLCNISSLQGEDGKPIYGYKIGKGKPLGMGSIELTVEGVQIRSLNKNGELHYHMESYQEKFGQSYQELTYEKTGLDEQVKEAFLRLCRFDAATEFPITYPVSNGQSVRISRDGHKWFTYNRYHANGGNKRITKRDELVFEQFFTPLKEESEIALYVNGERERGYPNAEAYGDEGVAANDGISENSSGRTGGNRGGNGNQNGNRNGYSSNQKHGANSKGGKRKENYNKKR